VRAAEVLKRLPDVVAAYRRRIANGAKAHVGGGESAIGAAREALRQLIVDGAIMITPRADHATINRRAASSVPGGHPA